MTGTPATAPRSEELRCLRCDRVLTQSDEIDLGTCRECEPRNWKRGDIVLNPRSGYTFTAVSDGLGGIEWLEMSPSAGHAQDHPPADAVLLVRYVDGKPLPVTDLGAGDLVAVEKL